VLDSAPWSLQARLASVIFITRFAAQLPQAGPSVRPLLSSQLVFQTLSTQVGNCIARHTWGLADAHCPQVKHSKNNDKQQEQQDGSHVVRPEIASCPTPCSPH
jgi:hypothetical protein